jgi:hypothetical protein
MHPLRRRRRVYQETHSLTRAVNFAGVYWGMENIKIESSEPEVSTKLRLILDATRRKSKYDAPSIIAKGCDQPAPTKTLIQPRSLVLRLLRLA